MEKEKNLSHSSAVCTPFCEASRMQGDGDENGIGDCFVVSFEKRAEDGDAGGLWKGGRMPREG